MSKPHPLIRPTTLADSQPQPGRIDGVVLGKVAAVRAGVVMVTHPFAPAGPGHGCRVMAMTAQVAVGDDVALMFQNGDPTHPILIGRLHRQGATAATATAAGPLPDDLVITTDTEKTTISHPRGLTLKCGKASISLSADGQVRLEGEYVLSVAKGLNRIAGGSVKLN